MKTTPLDNLMLIANEASGQLAEKIGTVLGTPVVKVIKKRFRDGEIYHAFPMDIGGKDVVIVGATHDDSSHQELIDLIDGCRCWNADSVNVVVPFLGYSTMERFKPNSGEIPKGITRTRQLFRTLENSPTPRETMTSAAPAAVSQRLTEFMNGNATSRAPICCGTTTFINPIRKGMAMKTIMIVPWVVKIWSK